MSSDESISKWRHLFSWGAIHKEVLAGDSTIPTCY